MNVKNLFKYELGRATKALHRAGRRFILDDAISQTAKEQNGRNGRAIAGDFSLCWGAWRVV